MLQVGTLIPQLGYPLVMYHAQDGVHFAAWLQSPSSVPLHNFDALHPARELNHHPSSRLLGLPASCYALPHTMVQQMHRHATGGLLVGNYTHGTRHAG